MEQTPIEELQALENEQEGGYQLKTNEQIIDIISEFGNGEIEFHTVDINRLILDIQRHEQLQAKHNEEIKQAIIEAYSYGCIEFGALEYTNLTYIEKAEAYYQTNHVTPVKD